MKKSMERAIGTVPRPVLVLLAAALALQIGWQALQPKPSARAEALGAPAAPSVLRTLALGEPIHSASAGQECEDSAKGRNVEHPGLVYI